MLARPLHLPAASRHARTLLLAVAMVGAAVACAAAPPQAPPAAAPMPPAAHLPAAEASPAPARPPNAVVLFDGKDLSKWKQDDGRPVGWKVVEGEALEVGSGDLVTREKFAGDFVLHVEFVTPAMPHATGQAKGNSGVYLADCYELQVLDSFGLSDLGLGDCGAVYSKHVPVKNAAKPAGEWQTFEAHYRAPRWDAAGTRTRPARLTLWWNGEMVHDNVELDGPCPGARAESPDGGPIRLQDHGNPVRFRNLWVAPLLPAVKG
jgi:hypothetical protein